MAQFNFTVRATDSEGSFADRQFSINVRNTKVDRYLTISGTDAYTSMDGISWTLRSGSGGLLCGFVNMTWIVVTSTGVRISNDAINLTAVPFTDERVTFVDSATGTVNASFALKSGNITPNSNVVKLGNYIGFMYRLSSTVTYFMKTQDGLTWEYTTMPAGFTSSAAKQYQLTYDSGTVLLGGQLSSGTTTGYRSDDNGKTWTVVSRATVSFSCSWLGRVNGLYIAFPQAGSPTTATMMTSNDGSNWVMNSFTTGTAYTVAHRVNSVFYLNGRLVALTEKFASGTGVDAVVLTSMDGVNWTMGSAGNLLASGSTICSTTSVMRNGKITSVSNTALQSGIRNSTDGLTFTTSNAAASGIASTVALLDLASM